MWMRYYHIMKRLLSVFPHLFQLSPLSIFFSESGYCVWKEHKQYSTNTTVWRRSVLECFASCLAFISASLWKASSSQPMHPKSLSYLTSVPQSCLGPWSLAFSLVSQGVNGFNSFPAFGLTTKTLTHTHTDTLLLIKAHTHSLHSPSWWILPVCHSFPVCH